jgi:hypothetical protein
MPCSWLAAETKLARRQYEIVREITKSGPPAYLTYDWQCDCDGAIYGDPPATEWLIKLLGIDFFSDIDAVQPGCGFYWEACPRTGLETSHLTTEERLAQLTEELKRRDHPQSVQSAKRHLDVTINRYNPTK